VAVSGVSGGAVNAAILASFPVGEEASAAQRMQTFWENSGNTKLWHDWPGGVAEGMFVKGGLYNDKPLYNFLASELTDIVPNQRFVDVALANIANGTIDEFYGNDLATGDLLDVMYGSFSFPGFFAPEVAMASDWFDGGMVWDIDVFSAVNKCMETHAQEDIVLDVVLADTRHLREVDASNYVTWQVLKRAAFIIRYTTQLDGLLRAQFAYPNIQWRHIIAPSTALPEPDLPMSFTAAEIDSAMTLGYDDAMAAINTPTEAADTLMYFALKKKRDKRIKGVTYEQFLELKAAGHFNDFAVKEDNKLKSLYTQ